METDSGARGESLLPGTPKGDIILDLDTRTGPKKPSGTFPDGKIPSGDHTRNPGADDVQEGGSSTGSAGTPSGKRVPGERSVSLDNAIDEKHQGFVGGVSGDRDVALGSDGRWYRLQRGALGRMGPPGTEVSGAVPILWAFALLLLCQFYDFDIIQSDPYLLADGLMYSSKHMIQVLFRRRLDYLC